MSLPSWYRSPDSWYNRSKSKILLVGIIAAIVICLLATRQDIIESSKQFIGNPLDAIQTFGILFVIGLVFIFGYIFLMKLITRAGLSDDVSGPPI